MVNFQNSRLRWCSKVVDHETVDCGSELIASTQLPHIQTCESKRSISWLFSLDRRRRLEAFRVRLKRVPRLQLFLQHCFPAIAGYNQLGFLREIFFLVRQWDSQWEIQLISDVFSKSIRYEKCCWRNPFKESVPEVNSRSLFKSGIWIRCLIADFLQLCSLNQSEFSLAFILIQESGIRTFDSLCSELGGFRDDDETYERGSETVLVKRFRRRFDRQKSRLPT